MVIFGRCGGCIEGEDGHSRAREEEQGVGLGRYSDRPGWPEGRISWAQRSCTSLGRIGGPADARITVGEGAGSTKTTFRRNGTDFTEAPKAIKAVTLFAQKAMGVKDVRITPSLNQAIWSRGVKSPPRRIRVRLERKRNDDEGAKEKLYVVASVVEGVTSFKVSFGFLGFWVVLFALPDGEEE